MTGLRLLGSVATNAWRVDEKHVSLVREPAAPIPQELAARPQDLTLDLARTGLVVIDMQNDFCHPDGWLGSIGVDVTPARMPIAPIQRLLPLCRATGMPVIWVNWGNRPDRLNLGPATHHVYDGDATGGGLGEPLGNGSKVLELGSWAAAIVDEFGDTSEDIHVAKYSMSGFWDTPLEAILRNLGLTSLLFAGVNLDQCVLATLMDASFRGFDCVLLEDCSATTSPAFCADAAHYNIAQCFGFVADSAPLAQALEDRA